MANLKSLAKETAIYGLSSIIGRFLNYLLVPLYTNAMAAATGDYGIVTNLYSYTALFLVLLTFGMETTFFRFANKPGVDPRRVYSTALWLVVGVGIAFLTLLYGFLPHIASALHYTTTPHFVAVMFTCVTLDAIQALPFALLRYQNRPLKFAALKLLFIGLNLGLNLGYFVLVPWLYTRSDTREWVSGFFDGTFDVGFVFYLNLACTATITFFFRQEFFGQGFAFDKALARQMLAYAWPILALGLVGELNVTVDKILFPFLASGDTAEAQVQLGIYGACAKIAMVMPLITQAFRYAYEPFVFGQSQDRNSPTTYAAAMKYFFIFSCLAFVGVVAYLDILKYIVSPSYHEGLRVVPIVMASGVLLGVFFNLSLWYKLTDRTIYGFWLSLLAAVVLITLNILFIPTYGYMACAWAAVAAYTISTLASYLLGQRFYPIPYDVRSMAIYAFMTLAFTLVMLHLPHTWPLWTRLAINTLLAIAFVAYILKKDFPIARLPLVGKYWH